MAIDIKVSICVPIYGVELFIRRCAVSLFEQTYSNIEYVFVNDCTKDNSMSILNDTIKSYPHRQKSIKIINHEMNKGLGAARNTAVKHATGDYIVWVDSDDYIEINAVEKLVDASDNGSIEIVLGSYIEHHIGYDKYIKQPIINDIMEYRLKIIRQQCPFTVWARLIKRKLYIDNSISVASGIDCGEDMQVTAILAYYANSIKSVHDFLFHYDCTNISSYTHSYSQKKQRQMWQSFDIVKSFFEDKDIEYKNATKYAELITIFNHLLVYSKYKNVDYFYGEAYRRLKSISKKYWIKLPLVFFIAISISPCKILLKAYLSSISTVHKFFFKLKNIIH